MALHQAELGTNTDHRSQSTLEFLFTPHAIAGLALCLASAVMLARTPVTTLPGSGTPFWMPHVIAAFALILGIVLGCRNRSTMQIFVAGALALTALVLGPELAAMGAQMAQAKQ